jgi:hypothetical protein
MSKALMTRTASRKKIRVESEADLAQVREDGIGGIRHTGLLVGEMRRRAIT